MPAILQRLVIALGISTTKPATQPEQSAEDLVVKGEFDAIDQLRALGRWLLTIFAAVAALLIAGVQVSSIGRLSLGDPRLWFAVVCGMLTLVSLAVILAMFVRVLSPATISMKKLTTEESRDPRSPDVRYLVENGYLGDHPSVAALYAAYQAPNATAAVQRRVDRVNATVLFERTRRRFQHAFMVTIPAAVLAALFIAGFVWAANPPAAPAGPFAMPAEANLKLDAPPQAALSDQLGPSCVTSEVHVIVLAVHDGAYDVVSVPSDLCKLLRFSVGDTPLGVPGVLTRRSPVAGP
jgi:hypothetical protein